ncbi:MAG: D-alanyl-D-alanine carboxypeptidase [Labilithrix sp.]|nr:D-alanyl-D-alanine carboxypeptidase [Labilithrix sp.]
MRARSLFAALVSVAAFAVLFLSDSGARSQTVADAAAPAGRSPELEAAVRSLVGGASFRDAAVSVVLMDVDSGAVLAQAGEHTLVNPASNAKLYTAAAALAILHGSHRYQTTLNGTIKAGVASNVVLRGHGDPSLRTSDLWELAQELKAHGAKRIDGDVTVDQRFFDEQTTPPAFEQQPNEWAAFRAPVSAVALNGNTVTLTVRPQAAGSNAVSFFDPPGFVEVEGAVKTAEAGADTVGLELTKTGEGGRKLAAKLSGAVSVDSRLVRYTKRVDDPQLLAGYALRSILEDSGIKVSGGVKLGGAATRQDDDADGEKAEKAEKKERRPGKSSVLARHESAPLSTLLYALGKNSDNFYAEMIFKSLAAEAKIRPGKSQDAAEVVTSWVDKNGLGDTGFVVKNGSGLFDANRTTAHSMAKLLRHAWQDQAIRNEFVAQLAIGGVDGTLHKRFRDARGRRAIRAKTGTLDDAIALSGYVLAPAGKGTVAYAILFNKVSGKGGAARLAADKLVETIQDRLWK